MSKSKVTKSPVKSAPQTPTMIHKHIDNFLAKIAGETPVDDKPRDSTEFWLNEIAENLPGGGTTVIANPETTGTEEELTALQVGENKYLIPSGGGSLYRHSYVFNLNVGSIVRIEFDLFLPNSTLLSARNVIKYIFDNYYIDGNSYTLPCAGGVYIVDNSHTYSVIGITSRASDGSTMDITYISDAGTLEIVQAIPVPASPSTSQFLGRAVQIL